MNAGSSTLPAGRVISVTALSREERGRELERIARAEFEHPGVLPESAARIIVSALASDRLQGSLLGEAWIGYREAVRLCQSIAIGETAGWGFDLGAEKARCCEALGVLLDGCETA